MTAVREIVADMSSDRKMHRLLQGDVGSGKTIVALFAALLAMENGYQAAIMAPTELLAEQHARTFTKLLEPLGIEPVLVTGSLSPRARKSAAQKLASTDPVLVVGTHALVQEATIFGRLGFVTIDEQHRFGVEQRAAISAKGDSPDVLLMSATPIPRSLALTTVRRSRSEHARRAARGATAGHDRAAAGIGARESARVRRPRNRERAGRPTSSIP